MGDRPRSVSVCSDAGSYSFSCATIRRTAWSARSWSTCPPFAFTHNLQMWSWAGIWDGLIPAFLGEVSEGVADGVGDGFTARAGGLLANVAVRDRHTAHGKRWPCRCQQTSTH